jgi:enolase-phosphatase E1
VETPGGEAIRAILLDIEGTTTPIDFVFKTLFPYARLRLGQFLAAHADEPEVRADMEALRAQHRADAAASLQPPAWIDTPASLELESAASCGQWLMDRGSKCSPLKSLQGKIWEEGYAKGELHGEVYPDVPPAFARWSAQRKIIAIFSSGSVLAQRLLFSSTASGDLTRFLTAYFDTTVGPKNARTSYAKIAAALQLDPPSILFISDVAKELDAARDAGMTTKLCVREQAVESGGVASMHVPINSFDGLFAR